MCFPPLALGLEGASCGEKLKEQETGGAGRKRMRDPNRQPGQRLVLQNL